MNEKNEEIESLATLQFTDEEIAQIMQINIEDLVRDYECDIDRGRLLAEAEVRKSILKIAKEGNTSAQKEFMSMNENAKSRSKTNR